MLCGGKIKNISVPAFNMLFRDSLAYVPTSLAKFPAVVGLTNLAKGAFPHHFNRPENWNNIVPFPQKHEFDYNKKSDRSSFDEWYVAEALKNGDHYNFNQEFIDYCRQVNPFFLRHARKN